MWFVTIRIFWRMWWNSCICSYRPFNERTETRREWVKDTSCTYHWMKTGYYRAKLRREKKRGNVQA